MNRRTNIVAMACFFSVLFMGCYTSTLIDPMGEEMEKIRTGKIEVVITKDGTKYEFEEPAKADPTQISGMLNGRQVSIPLEDVQKVQVSSFSPTRTVLVAGSVAGIISILAFAVESAAPK